MKLTRSAGTCPGRCSVATVSGPSRWKPVVVATVLYRRCASRLGGTMAPRTMFALRNFVEPSLLFKRRWPWSHGKLVSSSASVVERARCCEERSKTGNVPRFVAGPSGVILPLTSAVPMKSFAARSSVIELCGRCGIFRSKSSVPAVPRRFSAGTRSFSVVCVSLMERLNGTSTTLPA